MRTLKQRKATARLVAFNKKRKSKSSKPRRATVRKTRTVKSKHKSYNSMARRRKSSGRRSSVKSKFGNVFNRGMIGKVTSGIGAGTLAGIATNAFMPQATPIVKPLAAFAAGGIVGGIAQVLLDGGLSGFGNLIPNSNSNGGLSV